MPKVDPFELLLEPMLEKDTARCTAWKDEVQNILIFVCSTLHRADTGTELILNHLGRSLLSSGNRLHHRKLSTPPTRLQRRHCRFTGAQIGRAHV